MASNTPGVRLEWDGKRDGKGDLRPVERVPLPFQTIETINLSRAGRQSLGRFGAKGDGEDGGWRNKLIWGDNRYVLASLLEKFAGKVNLIYIDPPFATGADFSVNLKLGDIEFTKEASIIEEKVYRDTWGRGLTSYLEMLHSRMQIMRDLLADTGSIYVHLDWHVGHYVKIMMDEIFGKENFQNEIVWRREVARGMKAYASFYGHNTDHILLYTKNPSGAIWNPVEGEEIFTEEEAAKSFKKDGGGFFSTSHRGTYSDQSIIELNKANRVFVTKGGKLVVEDGRVSATKGTIRIKYYLERKGDLYAKKFAVDNLWTDIRGIAEASPEERVNFPTQKPEALLERIVGASSNPNDLVADLFCGSGTTLAVAEKLGRRWLGCDLSRFAIHVTRKRLLDIPDCRPFEVLDIGRYERQFWQRAMASAGGNGENGAQPIYEYLAFIVRLYRAEPISGFTHLHGRKGGRVVHVGAVDSPVTLAEIREALEECRANKLRALDVLGWEWEMGLNDLVVDEAKRWGVDLRLLHIPREVMDRRAVEAGDVHFYELAHLDAGLERKNGRVSVVLKNFVIPNPELIPPDVRDKVRKWSDFIDYWAVDWDYRDDTFHNEWQAYRTRKEPALALKSEPHTYEKPGKYAVLVKVIDIFGNDTSKLLEVEVK